MSKRLGTAHVASWRETYAGILPDDVLACLTIEARSSMWGKILGGPSAFAGTAVYIIEDKDSIVGLAPVGGNAIPV